VRRRSVLTAIGAAAVLVPAIAAPSEAVSSAHSSVVSANPVDYTPHIQDGRTLAVAAVAGKIIIGGTFSRVRDKRYSADIPRRYIFAFDATTGKVDRAFAPTVDGVVETIAPAPDGMSVIIGGAFKHVNGATQGGLAKLSVANGARDARFKARTGGRVEKAIVRGNRLIAGGGFTTANGVKRSRLAAFNATTGALDTGFNIAVTESRYVDAAPSVKELDASPDGSKLVVIGNFRRVNGLYRNQIAMINLTNNSVSPWATDRFSDEKNGNRVFYTYMRDVEFSPDGSYFAIVTTGACMKDTLRDTASRWETNPQTANRQPTWVNYTGGDSLFGVAVTGAAVYVGGHQRWMSNPHGCNEAGPGAIEREGIAALAPGNGAVLPWNPGRSRGVGVEEMVATSRGLYVGSDTTRLGGEYHARIGFFPLN